MSFSDTLIDPFALRGVGRWLVWKHGEPCPPTAASTKARARAAKERAARQARRERAAELFTQGRTQAEVAASWTSPARAPAAGIPRWQADGTAALRTRGPTGRRPKVADGQLEGIEQALLEGALAHGFPTDVWRSMIAKNTSTRLSQEA
jgi:hypothetical protein